MNTIVIDFYAEDDYFFIPGCTYYWDPGSHYGTDEERDELLWYEKLIKKGRYSTVFIEYTYDNEHYNENDGIRLGVIGKFLNTHHGLAIKILTKGTLYKDDEGDLVFEIDPFIRKASNLTMLESFISKYEKLSFIHDYDNLNCIDNNDHPAIKLLKIVDSLIPLENIPGRNELFHNYDVDFYVEVMSLILKTIEGHTILPYHQGNLAEVKAKTKESLKNETPKDTTKIYNPYPFYNDLLYNFKRTKDEIYLDGLEIDSEDENVIFHQSLVQPLYSEEKEENMEIDKVDRDLILKKLRSS